MSQALLTHRVLGGDGYWCCDAAFPHQALSGEQVKIRATSTLLDDEGLFGARGASLGNQGERTPTTSWVPQFSDDDPYVEVVFPQVLLQKVSY